MKRRAYDWLDQFENDADIDCAIELLKGSRMISRSDIVGALRTFIVDNPEFKTASVVSISKGNDSSQIVQYFAADLGGDLKFYGSLSEAAREARDGAVLVVDDFCGSGNQWVNTLGSLFGESDLQRPELKEQRLLGLDVDQDFLRDRKVGFVFTAGWDAGAKHVEEAAVKLGLDAKVYVHITEDALPFADNLLAGGDYAERAVGFLERAGSIGATLLKLNEPDWSSDKVEERKLGYGNRGMLLFFPYNAPSQTLTCMWAAGEVDGEDWEPIIRRRKKA